MSPQERHDALEDSLSESRQAMLGLAKLAGQRARARGEPENPKHYGAAPDYADMNAAWLAGWQHEHGARVPRHVHVWESQGLYDECECGETRA